MPCYKPLNAWQSKAKRVTGKSVVVFKSPSRKANWEHLQLPCGQCIGCRLERSRQWAVRCVHEASLHSDNCFITLTFDDNHLNKCGSLDKRDFVLFMKRLRKLASCDRKFKKACRKKFGKDFLKVKFFHCGEYGAEFGRPHHHACLFNFDFPNKVLWREKDGIRLYRSKFLERLWSDPVSGESYGFSTIGQVNFESAAYVARYVIKKITGDKAEAHYLGRLPEYVTMSRRPGLGADWYDKFGKSDVYADGCVVVRGKRCAPPRYYDVKFEVDNAEDFIMIKAARKERAKANPANHWRRLPAREKVKEAQASMLKRSV